MDIIEQIEEQLEAHKKQKLDLNNRIHIVNGAIQALELLLKKLKETE